MTQAELLERCEALVDGSTLQAVLRALVEVCDGKGEHIQANWQDRETAKPWYAAARRIEAVANKVEV